MQGAQMRAWLVVLAAGGSALMLAGAFAFQHLGGMAPCPMCLWQRWPHAAAVILGLLAQPRPRSLWPWAGMAAALATSGLGLYHAGVERKWWPGPASCTGGVNPSGLSSGDLLNQILAAPVVRCDQISWEWMGLSMPAWNAVVSLGLAALWLAAALRRDRRA